MREVTILVSSLLTHSANHKQYRQFKRLAASTIASIVYDYPTILPEHGSSRTGCGRGVDRVLSDLVRTLLQSSSVSQLIDNKGQ